MPARGRLVTVEGGEGAGKSTLAGALAERAEAAGAAVVRCREPGGTTLGERVREALLGIPGGGDAPPAALPPPEAWGAPGPPDRTPAGGGAPDPRAELLLFAAARAQLAAEVIRPALASGALVICDRFADSTLAYQHHGRGLPRALAEAANAASADGLTPDLTLLLDLPAAEGLRRAAAASAASRGRDYIERAPRGFHERVREGYLAEARRAPERWVVLDAARPPQALAAAAWERVAALLAR